MKQSRATRPSSANHSLLKLASIISLALLPGACSISTSSCLGACACNQRLAEGLDHVTCGVEPL